eukprot:2012453-Rhodomonas_salina.4
MPVSTSRMTMPALVLTLVSWSQHRRGEGRGWAVGGGKGDGGSWTVMLRSVNCVAVFHEMQMVLRELGGWVDVDGWSRAVGACNDHQAQDQRGAGEVFEKTIVKHTGWGDYGGCGEKHDDDAGGDDDDDDDGNDVDDVMAVVLVVLVVLVVATMIT